MDQEYHDQLQNAVDEWDAVSKNEGNYFHSDTGIDAFSQLQSITTTEYWQNLRTRCSSMCPMYTTEQSRNASIGFLRTLLSCLWKPQLSNASENEKRIIQEAARTSFDSKQTVDVQALYTIFRNVTHKEPHGRFGTHWECIGFQGNDPATDLRGVGVLGLLQLLHFSEAQANSKHLQELVALSNDAVQNFPLGVMSLNLTRISLHVLKSGKLDRCIAQENEAIAVFNRFHIGLFHQFLHIWKTGAKSIADAGFVLKELETYATKRTKSIMNKCSYPMSGNPIQRVLYEKQADIFHEI